MTTAFSELASILYPAAESISLNGAQDPLFSACQMVGNALNIPIKAHPGALKQVSQQRALLNIVAASRIRMRRVALRNEWWNDDNGPMLGFLGEGQYPVALLPTSPHSYILCDPISHARCRSMPSLPCNSIFTRSVFTVHSPTDV